jgi:hypothetical protein
MTYLDVAAECKLIGRDRVKHLALKHIYRLRKAPYAELGAEEIALLRGIYQSEVNRLRMEAGPELPGLEPGEGPAVYLFDKWRVRIVLKERKPWFVAMDVLEALGYDLSNVGNKIDHVPAKWRGRYPIATPGGEQEVNALSLEGLFHFLNRSDKPAAQPFQEWVNGTVLVQIHEKGKYEAPAAPETPKLPHIPASEPKIGLVREYRLAAQHKIISSSDFALLVGLPALRAAAEAPRTEEPKAPAVLADAKFAELQARVGGQS